MLQFRLGAQITTLDHSAAHLWKILWPQSWYNSYKLILDHSSFQNSSMISKQNKIENKTQALLQLTLHTLTPPRTAVGVGGGLKMKSVHENRDDDELKSPKQLLLRNKARVSLALLLFWETRNPWAGMGLSFDLRHGPLLLTAQGTTTASPLAFGGLDSSMARCSDKPLVCATSTFSFYLYLREEAGILQPFTADKVLPSI